MTDPDTTNSEASGLEASEAELDLRAVRYISGEMARSETETFEDLLATSQGARDSVERAVLLGTAVVHAEHVRQTGAAPLRCVSDAPSGAPTDGPSGAPSDAPKVAASRRRWTIVAAVAAVWIAVVGVWWLRDRTDPTDLEPETAGARVAAESGEQPDLLASWVDLETLDQAGLDAPEDSSGPWGDLDALAVGESAPSDELAVVETPAWMLEALEK